MSYGFHGVLNGGVDTPSIGWTFCIFFPVQKMATYKIPAAQHVLWHWNTYHTLLRAAYSRLMLRNKPVSCNHQQAFVIVTTCLCECSDMV